MSHDVEERVEIFRFRSVAIRENWNGQLEGGN